MTEVPVLAEELAMIGGDDDPGVAGQSAEQLGEDAVEVLDGTYLA